MIVSYGLRLLCACLAVLFLAQVLATAAAWLLTPIAVRLAPRLPAASAARLILSMRLLPTAIAIACVAVLCIPSYLHFEPERGSEELGLLCLSLATLGVTTYFFSIRRAVKAVILSARHRRACVQGVSHGFIRVVEGPGALCELYGILRPRLFVSRAILKTLSADELAVSLRHERAHLRSLDNLKRLLLLLAPRLLGTMRLEREWARFSELAADDQAGGGNPERSLALASALVQAARLGAAAGPALVAPLIGNQQHLAERVERLLTLAGSRPQNRMERAAWWFAATLVIPAAVCLASTTSMHGMYTLIEALIH